MKIAILLYNGVTALDAMGPYEVLAATPNAEIRFVAREPGLIQADSGIRVLNADSSFADVPDPDIIVLPGCEDPSPAIEDAETMAWVSQAHQTSKWTTSVCTGALILGAAGILDGLRATTHWLAHHTLSEFGAIPTLERVVREGKVVTAAGVSSGIDMALTLTAAQFGEEVAQEIQLILEYDPQPPFDAGSPLKAPEHVVEGLRKKYA